MGDCSLKFHVLNKEKKKIMINRVKRNPIRAFLDFDQIVQNRNHFTLSLIFMLVTFFEIHDDSVQLDCIDYFLRRKSLSFNTQHQNP